MSNNQSRPIPLQYEARSRFHRKRLIKLISTLFAAILSLAIGFYSIASFGLYAEFEEGLLPGSPQMRYYDHKINVCFVMTSLSGIVFVVSSILFVRFIRQKPSEADKGS